jgi:LmbE family N-acetylglucosaminyl deacetylase
LGDKKIIVFAPHPDDETYGCGGTIAKKLHEGYEVIVVVMTDGRYAFSEVLGITTDPTPEELKIIREEEVKRSTRILGLPENSIIFLDFEDGTLGANGGKAEEEVMRIMNTHKPVEVYFTYRKDSHPDHQATYRIVKTCVEKSAFKPTQYQYSILHKYARVGKLMDRVLYHFKLRVVKNDVSEFVHLKEKALQEFKSETSLISKQQQKPMVTKTDVHARNEETFYVEN